MRPRPHISFCACIIPWLAPEWLVSTGPCLHLWFLHIKQWLLDQIYKSLWVPALICGFCIQNSNFWTSIQVSMDTRPHMLFCACKTAWLAPELLDSMGFSPNLCTWFCAFKTATLGPKLHVSMCPRPHQWFSACKKPSLASELLVSMGSSPHLWFLHAKQRLLDPNNKSLWFPEITCHFVHTILHD